MPESGQRLFIKITRENLPQVRTKYPFAVRGRMKLWFVEPRPNVFISGIKDSVADDVVAYLLSKCPAESGVIIFKRKRHTPGYTIHGSCINDWKITNISGLQLIIEKRVNEDSNISIKKGENHQFLKKI